jgi:hypothetical protein
MSDDSESSLKWHTWYRTDTPECLVQTVHNGSIALNVTINSEIGPSTFGSS